MKRLYRSRNNKMIAGICGGLGEYTNLDPTIWRLIFFVLMFPGGVPGPLIYVLMWIIVPKSPKAAK